MTSEEDAISGFGMIWGRIVVHVRLAVVVIALLHSEHLAAAKTTSWTEYTSHNFVVYSDRKPAEARRMLVDFERFREAALTLMGLPAVAENERTQIFLFNRPRDYREIQPDRATAGYFRDTWQGPRMVVGAETGLADAGLVLFHEYVHYLMRTRSQIRYPLWYEEGLADLLSASLLETKGMVVGLVHPWRRKDIDRDGLLSVLDLHTPQDSGDSRYWSRYYASAWVLMHYLQLGHLNGQSDYRAGLAAYISALNRGDDIPLAMQHHLGIAPGEIDIALKAYVEKRIWTGYRLEVRHYAGPLTERRLSANEVAYLLGDLAYRSGQQKAALEWLKKIDAKQNSVARAFSLRAVIEQHQGKSELALHILGLALKNSPNDAYVLTNAAHVYWDRARKSDVKKAPAQDQLARAATHAQNAIRVDENGLEAAYFLAQIYRLQGKITDAITLLEGFHSRYPSDVRLNLELGALLAAKKDSLHAVPYLQRVIAFDHADTRRRQARRILGELGVSSERAAAVLDEEHVPIQILPP